MPELLTATAFNGAVVVLKAEATISYELFAVTSLVFVLE
jgi:hypothetical protein